MDASDLGMSFFVTLASLTLSIVFPVSESLHSLFSELKILLLSLPHLLSFFL